MATATREEIRQETYNCSLHVSTANHFWLTVVNDVQAQIICMSVPVGAIL